MKYLSLLFLSLLVLAFAALSHAESGEAANQKKRRDTCGGLVEEPPTHSSSAAPTTSAPVTSTEAETNGTASPGGGDGGEGGHGEFHSHCPLIVAFYNMSSSLSVELQVVWEAWIQEVENNILANSSLTADEKVVMISISLKAFFAEHLEIYYKLSYVEIANWGFVIDFLYVSISIQIEYSQSVVTIGSGGSCALIDAIQEASESVSSDEKAACQKLIVDIRKVLEDSSLSYEEKMSQLYVVIQTFCSQHADMESWLMSINIQGYGSVQSLVDVCLTYHRIVTISTVISGSSTSDCVLLQALQEASTNSSFTAEQQQQIVQLLNKLQVEFKSETSISGRLAIISNTCYQMFKQEPWMVEIVESIMCGEWGSIYDLIFCSGVCDNDGCGNLDGEGSTSAPSTTASSVQPADCGTIESLIVVSEQNTTVITDVLTEAYNSWNASTKSGFNSCFNKVRRAIWDDTTFPTEQSKFKELHADFSAYNANNKEKQQVVYNLTISSWHGTIGQFVQCCANRS